jgi:hypothetical protein
MSGKLPLCLYFIKLLLRLQRVYKNYTNKCLPCKKVGVKESITRRARIKSALVS